MIDVQFEDAGLPPIASRKSDGVFVNALVRWGITSSPAVARLLLVATGCFCFAIASMLFFRTINEEPLNAQREIPPELAHAQS